MPDERTYGFNADDAASLLQSIGTGETTYAEIRPRGGMSRLQVVLTSDLPAAVNTKRDPSTATARVLRRKTDGDLTLSTDSITIVNRFTQISVDAGTYGKAEMIDGEWQLYAADCPGGSASSGGV
jgi:hypothetical protein